MPNLPRVAAPAAPADPFQWLEDITGAKAVAWVQGQNAKTRAVLEADPRYETFRQEALAIFTAQDRIASPRFRGKSPLGLYGDVVEELDWSVGEVLASAALIGSPVSSICIATLRGSWCAMRNTPPAPAISPTCSSRVSKRPFSSSALIGSNATLMLPSRQYAVYRNTHT